MSKYGPQFYDKRHRDIVGVGLNDIKLRCESIAPWLIGNVLDLGCGLGHMKEYCHEGYFGIDFSPYAVAYATEHFGPYFLCADILSLDWSTLTSYDTILMAEFLEHLENPQFVVDKARQLSPKRIIATVPVNIHCEGHIKPEWTTEDLYNLFGHCHIETIDGKWHLCVSDEAIHESIDVPS